MASKLPVWGIDVGQCSLKAVKLQATGDDKVELLAFDLVEHDQILSQADTEATDLIHKAIETFVGRNDLSGSRIVVAVPGQQTLTRFTKMPPVDAKKIPDMVQYEASQQIPFDMDEVVWDYQVFAEEDSVEVEVGIFAIRKELIRSYLSQFTELGIDPSIVQASPMASYNTARFELPLAKGEATILLDMGALATDLIVLEGNRIWSRPVPIGGNRFTEALVTAFKIPFKKAERLKRNAATSKYARQIFQAMRPVFSDLASEIQRSVGFYTSTHREANITRIIGMGNAFKLPGLQKYLLQNLQIKVEKLGSFQNLIEGSVAKKPEFDDNKLSLAVAYGLALQGLGLAAVDSNLLPTEVRRTLLWQRKRPWFAAAAACLALASGALWGSNISAKGQLDAAFGGTFPQGTTIPKPRPATVDAAMAVLSSAPGDAPVAWAAKVGGAAEYLKQAYVAEGGKISPDKGTLSKLAEYPERNVLVPRILDVIHRAFEETRTAELKTLTNGVTYKALAGRIDRAERKEMWIEELIMAYATKPEAASKREDLANAKSEKAGAGWAMSITGITTEPAPKWIEETLVAKLLELGCEPDRGFYFDEVNIDKVVPVGKQQSRGRGDVGGSRGQDDRAGRGRPGARGPGRPGGRGGGGQRGDSDRPGMLGPGGGGESSRPPSSGEGAKGAADWLQKLGTKDPLTMEETRDDMRFVLRVVIRKAQVPAARIPERFKPKPAEDTKAAESK